MKRESHSDAFKCSFGDLVEEFSYMNIQFFVIWIFISFRNNLFKSDTFLCNRRCSYMLIKICRMKESCNLFLWNENETVYWISIKFSKFKQTRIKNVSNYFKILNLKRKVSAFSCCCWLNLAMLSVVLH